MVNLKKVLAVVLSTTMVVGGSFTVFAADENTGSQDGAGASEGHVDKEVVDVVLPTTAETTFAYTMDPERLISATEAAKYGKDVVFPDAEGDTGIYFLTGEKTYSNTSSKVQVVNKGAVNQALTVTATLTAGEKDIDILDKAPTDDYYEDEDTKDKAGLYLAAKVAGVTQALSADGATWIINLTGTEANYEVAYDNTKEAYVFQKKASDLDPWKAADIELTGAVTEGIAIEEDTTAPKVTLTWKFEDIDPDEEPEWTESEDFALSDFIEGAYADPASMSTKVKSAAIKGLADGVKLKSAKVIKEDGSSVALTASTQYTFTNNTFAIVSGKEVLLDNTKYTKFVLTFSDGSIVNIAIVAGE